MTTATNVPDFRDPVVEYQFSEFRTNTSTSHRELPWPSASKAGATFLLTGIAMLGGLNATSIGGHNAPVASFVTVGRTERGELALADTPAVNAPVSRVVGGAESRSDREVVIWIKGHSGLTWDQLGKVFGVSRRAVHMWANGGRLNESNARRLREFSAIVRRVESETPQLTPEQVRARLLRVESDGLSIVDRLRREHSAGPTWGAPFGPERVVAAIREPLRTPVGGVGR